MPTKEISQRLVLALGVIASVVAAFFYTFNLSSQGFSDSDEFSAYDFLTRELETFRIHGVSGGFWGRPVGHLFSILALKFFPEAPATLLYQSAIFGLFLLPVLFRIGERWLNRGTGPLTVALLATTFSGVYWIRSMKMVAPTFLFCALAIYFLFRTKDRARWFNYLGVGLSLAGMFTTHPNSLPMTAVVLSLLALLTLIKIAKARTLPDRIRIFFASTAAPLAVASVMLVAELYYWVLRKYFPFWEIGEDVGYFRALFYHGNLGKIGDPTVEYYFSSFGVNGNWFLWGIAISSIAVLLVSRFRKVESLLLVALFWGPILFYAATDVVAVGRNVITSFLPACLMISHVLAGLVPYLQRLRIKHATEFGFSAIFGCILILGGYRSWTCTQGMSAAQEIYDSLNGSHALLTRPSASVYHWADYYFADRDLFVSNWGEVFQKYLEAKAEYLVQLQPDATKAAELIPPAVMPTREFRHLSSYAADVNFGLLDLNRDRKIFENKFGFRLAATAALPETITLTGTTREALSAFDVSKAVRRTIELPQHFQLLRLGGKIPLKNPEDVLAIAIGTEDDPFAYNLQLFQGSKEGVSLHTIWRINRHVPRTLVVSFLLAQTTSSTLELNNLKVEFLRLPKSSMPFAENCGRLELNTARNEAYTMVLARFSPTYDVPKTINFTDKNNFQIASSDYLPARRYRVKFTASTNRLSVGRLTLSAKPGPYSVVELSMVRFWKWWSSSYEVEFTTIVAPSVIEGHFDNPIASKSEGTFTVAQIQLELVED